MDKEDFIAAIRNNQKLIYKICHSYCTDAENRKDLEQEILLQLWQSFKTFDGRVKLTTWMYKVALNTAISFYRNDRKQKQRKAVVASHIIAQQKEHDSADENINLLYRFINQLNEMDKALILLYLDNHKYTEIATIMGLSTTNVATKISRIKKALKQAFANNQNQVAHGS